MHDNRPPSERLKDDIDMLVHWAMQSPAAEELNTYVSNVRAILKELDEDFAEAGKGYKDELERLLTTRKDKTGILYRDKEISVSRSACGVVSMHCPSPVEVWHSSNGGACISVPVFEQRGGGVNQRGRKPPKGYKRAKD